MMPSSARVFVSQRAGLLVPFGEAEGAAYQQRRDGSPRVGDHRGGEVGLCDGVSRIALQGLASGSHARAAHPSLMARRRSRTRAAATMLPFAS
jgi:hypothetical protein